MRVTARSGFLFLSLAAVTLTGCRVPQPPRVETAGMRIDVRRAKQGRRGVDCVVRFWNDRADAVRFTYDQVFLIHGESEVSPNPGRRTSEVTVEPQSRADVRWLFTLTERLPAGSYDIEVRDFRLGGVPSGETALFAVNVK